MEKRSQRHQSMKVLRKRRKLRKRRIFLFILLALFLVVGGYSVIQYYLGKNQAANGMEEKSFAFNGEKDSKGRVNILLIGVDSRKGNMQSNSDTMIIAQYDPKREKAKLVSLMRDIYTPMPGYDNYKKLNAANLLGGPELLRKTIKQDFDIDVQYYVIIDFKGFEHTIDALAPDGIEINVEKAMSKNIGVSLQPGVQKLNGKEMLGYARFRHDAESDFGRVRRQQQVLKAVADEVLSANGVVKAPKMLGTIEPYIQTNIGTLDSLSLLKNVFFFDTKNLETLTVPVKDTYTNERVLNSWVIQTDFELNKQAIHKFLDD